MTTHTPKFTESPLWARYLETTVTSDSSVDLTDFKSNGINHKISMWNPATNGLRYFRFLIYHIGMNLSEKNLARLRRIPNREVGTPTTIRCHGEHMCMDYLLAVHELDFLAEHLPLDGMRLLEIGAGYGRTCHTLMSNHDLASYHIVDLPNTLALSRAYLTRVLPPEQRAKVHFTPIDRAPDLFATTTFDLGINIDSMAEMSPRTVRNYLADIDQVCHHLYVANPVGKYMDKSLDNHSDGADVVRMAMETGPLHEVFDINDMNEVEARVQKYLDAYRPGPAWEAIANAPHLAYPHYWQGLFRKRP
jgi:putative sugar O-methyltransferase